MVETQFDAAADQRGHLLLAVGRQHDERVFDAPVGGVGDVRHARQRVELDVLAVGVARQHAARALAQIPHLREVAGEAAHRLLRHGQQFAHRGVTHRIVVRRAALLDLGQPVRQRVDQCAPALGVVEQVVFEVGVALHDPDVAQHLVQHACRAAGAAFGAQAATTRPTRARRAGESRSRDRRRTCSCRGSRAGAARLGQRPGARLRRKAAARAAAYAVRS